jgi:hypothetical protein
MNGNPMMCLYHAGYSRFLRGGAGNGGIEKIIERPSV